VCRRWTSPWSGSHRCHHPPPKAHPTWPRSGGGLSASTRSTASTTFQPRHPSRRQLLSSFGSSEKEARQTPLLFRILGFSFPFVVQFLPLRIPSLKGCKETTSREGSRLLDLSQDEQQPYRCWAACVSPSILSAYDKRASAWSAMAMAHREVEEADSCLSYSKPNLRVTSSSPRPPAPLIRGVLLTGRQSSPPMDSTRGTCLVCDQDVDTAPTNVS
jgi:hypothetical protein